MKYFLMNKNCIMLEFESRNISGRDLLFLDPDKIEILPLGFKDINSFIESRTIVSNRESIERILAKTGINSRFELALANYGVSLNDTLWIKAADDSRTWESISPYSQKHSFDISWFFEKDDKNALHIGRPEYSTSGNYPKCWITKDDSIYMLKCGTSGAYNAGLEPFSELYVCQLEKALGIEQNAVKYELTEVDYSGFGTYKQPKLLMEVLSPDVIKDNMRIASICQLFTSEQYGFISARDAGFNTYDEILEETKKYGQDHIVAGQLLLDCLSLNVDRHLGNIGFLVDNDAQKIKGVAPIFDNNLALAPYWIEMQDGSIEEYADTCYPKVYSSFTELGQKVLTAYPQYRKYVEEVAENYSFEPIGAINFSADRLEALSKLVRYQAKRIIDIS